MEQIFTNRPATKQFTINFFYQCKTGIESAMLACPFFTDPKPIVILKDKGCERIRLLVRLCESTSPNALTQIKAHNGVDIRYYTSSEFHAKFYIIEDSILVGSANLTGSGLHSNRELSLSIRPENELFDEIVMLFDELWNGASVLTDDALAKFQIWYRKNKHPELPDIGGIEPCSPKTIDVNTQRENKIRNQLEKFRSLYVETLIPAHKTVQKIYGETCGRHYLFEEASSPYDYEIDRFLFWVKEHTTDDNLYSHKHPLRSGDDLHKNIRRYVSEWSKHSLTVDRGRIRSIMELRRLFGEEKRLQTVDLDEITDLLYGACAAFLESQRFIEGGSDYGISDFKRHNSIEQIRTTFHHLIYGSGDYVQRVYDCINHRKYKLYRWGINSTLELFGWVNDNNVPPFNLRTKKALRFLGFDALV